MNADVVPEPARLVRPARGLILALHARHDACCRGGEAIARAREDHRSDPEASLELGEAADANAAEREALRRALLLQAPQSWAEALILAYHLAAALDSAEEDRTALRFASDSLFDYMASRLDIDHEPLGEGFQLATVTALRRRQLRAGSAEEGQEPGASDGTFGR